MQALAAGNQAYEQRFGHIYLVCASGRSGPELLALLSERLGNDPDAEWRVVRSELEQINRIRLRKLLDGGPSARDAPGRGAPMTEAASAVSAVTTHVLDTARGRPAAGVPVRLEQVSGPGATEIATAATDRDGRVSSLGPDRLPPGVYRLVFDTAAYFGGRAAGAREAFFPEVAVTFRIDGAALHYHVPLLLSPFGYSTYRGS